MSLLKIEGKCFLFLSIVENKIRFYTDGLNVCDVFELIAYTGEIKIGKMMFERGISESYKCYSDKDFKRIETYCDLLNLIKIINNEMYSENIHIYNFEIESENFVLSIHDNRDFNITFNGVNGNVPLIRKIISVSFGFSIEVTDNIYKSLVLNNDKLLMIDTKGNLIGIYNNFDEYLSLVGK